MGINVSMIRHGVNSNSGIDGQFQFWNCLFKKNEIDKFLIGMDKFDVEKHLIKWN